MAASNEVQQLIITLPTHVDEAIRAKVSSGEYASEGEMIENALEAAMTPPVSDSDLEYWIATEGVRRYDAMRANPARGLTSEEVFASLGMEPEELSKAD